MHSRPSITGMCTSSRTRSNCSAASRSSASWPLCASCRSEAQRRQEQPRHLPVDRVVVDDQHARADAGRPGRRAHGVFPRRGAFGAQLGLDLQREGRALARLAGHGHIPAHHAGQPPRDGEAQAAAAKHARGGGVGLGEVGEELGQRLGAHADAGVAHGDSDPIAVVIKHFGAEADAVTAPDGVNLMALDRRFDRHC